MMSVTNCLSVIVLCVIDVLKECLADVAKRLRAYGGCLGVWRL